MILELCERIGLRTKRESANEYSAPCPRCGGVDRLCLSPNKGSSGLFWCRRCKEGGDGIDFCRRFLGLTFSEAKNLVGLPDRHLNQISSMPIQPIRLPTRTWREKAEDFVEAACKRLLIDPERLELVQKKYGLKPDSIRRFRVGWNSEQRLDRRSAWGLIEEEKKLLVCLPRGLVAPTFYDETVSKIKIRRADWAEGARFPKYQEICGSSNRMPVYGFRANQVCVVVESELDAMTLCQEIGEFGTCIATGGSSKRPDAETSEWLRNRKLILYAQDYDSAGCENFNWWRSMFPNVRAWPAETRKSPVDSFVLDAVNLKAWFSAGVRHWGGSP